MHIEAEGFSTVERDVEVAADVCHVETEIVVETLAETICPGDAVVSALVDVTDIDSGDPVLLATVEYDFGDGFAACTGGGDTNEWACGAQQWGEMTLRIEADSYEDFEQVFTVMADEAECHPVPLEIDAQLTSGID